MITIHDRDEIPVGFSNDTNDRYCIIASFESPDEVEKFISDHNIMNFETGWIAKELADYFRLY